MGIVWEAYHNGVPLLRVLESPLNNLNGLSSFVEKNCILVPIPYHPLERYIDLHLLLISMVNVGKYTIDGCYGHIDPNVWNINMMPGFKQNYAKIMYGFFPDVMSTKPSFECITKNMFCFLLMQHPVGGFNPSEKYTRETGSIFPNVWNKNGNQKTLRNFTIIQKLENRWNHHLIEIESQL